MYVAIFSLVYVDDLFLAHAEDDASAPAVAFRNRGGRPGGFCLLALAAGPVGLVFYKITRILEDFTVVANISDMKNRRVIELVLRRQKTVAAFEALKVVQCLRSPAMLLEVIATPETHPDDVRSPTTLARDDAASPTASESDGGDMTPFALRRAASSPAGARGPKRKKKKRRASALALSELRREESDIYFLRLRSHWHRIFALFDEDGEGSIDRAEMRDLLVKFACDATPEEIDAIIEHLDEDASGEISFDEFFHFATKLTHYLATCDPDALIADMFSLIDQDDSGTITVHEMHNVVHEMLGQDLSVEDVFNVVQDIDVDGNGELDLEEFSVLLERFGIYH